MKVSNAAKTVHTGCSAFFLVTARLSCFILATDRRRVMWQWILFARFVRSALQRHRLALQQWLAPEMVQSC